jgi:hypothetical protein
MTFFHSVNTRLRLQTGFLPENGDKPPAVVVTIEKSPVAPPLRFRLNTMECRVRDVQRRSEGLDNPCGPCSILTPEQARWIRDGDFVPDRQCGGGTGASHWPIHTVPQRFRYARPFTLPAS